MRTRLSAAIAAAALASTLSACATSRTTDAAEAVAHAPRYSTPVSQEPIAEGAPVQGAKGYHRAGRLIVGGQPDRHSLDTLAEDGVTHIINLRSNAEMATAEARWFVPRAQRLGMHYTHIPLGGKDGYEPADVQAFRDALAACDGTVLVMCASGGRARTMWTAYLVEDKGYSLDSARAIERTLGGEPTGLEQLLGHRISAQIAEPLPPKNPE